MNSNNQTSSKNTAGSWRQRLLINAGVFLFTLALIELLCFSFFYVFKDRFSFFDIRALTMSKSQLERAKRSFNAELGWVKNYQTPFGERARTESFPQDAIATFGDSFTHGDEVRDADTYQNYLAEKLHANVYNFGVGGYGTDQAYMRFLRDGDKTKSPIIVLGLISENINRVVNVYRMFYYPRSALSLPKPRFVLRDSKLELIPNPIQRVEDFPLLEDPEFVESLGRNDWWYNVDRHPKFAFPFSSILLNKRLWLEQLHQLKSKSDKGDQLNDINARPWEDLWEDPEARNLMNKIFESFVTDVRAMGRTPIIALSPRKSELAAVLRGRSLASVENFTKFCESHGVYCYNAFPVFEKWARAHNNEYKPLYTHHFTPLGNKVFAEGFYEFLEKNDLLKMAAPPR